MTSLRSAEIGKQFQEWAERLTPPQGIKNNPKAMQAEWDALLKVLLRFAPGDGYNGWVAEALERCGMNLKTRAWPTVHELGAACSNFRKESRSGPDAQAAPPMKSEHQIIADRMARGEPVGEGWLYGRAACELIRQRLVDQATMSAYRSGAFFARKDTYGQAAALAWEAEAKAKHEAAKEAFRDDTPHHGPVSVEAKRFGDAA